jgi:hypothetical protein
MPIDLAAAQAVSPQDAPVVESPAEFSIDLDSAKVITPQEAPEKAEFRTRAGVILVKWLLVIISAFVLITVIWIWSSEIEFSNRVESLIKPGVALTKDVVDPLLNERANFREFWLKIFQMVLLNVLLPVLTALLGYVFGSSARDQKDAAPAA